MNIEKFVKLLPLHMKNVDKVLEKKQERLFNEDASSVDVEVENEVLWEIAQFLKDKLNDIKIDSIRHGLNSEDDYSWRFGKPSESILSKEVKE